jgi:serine/threonine protein kinase
MRGITLGSYFKTDEIIANSTVSTVWKGFKLGSETELYAVKQSRALCPKNILLVKRCLLEIELLRHLQHENIITLADVFFEPGATVKNYDSAYLIFPRLDCDLHNLNQKTKIPMDTIIIFTLQILKALKYIHSAKVLHRDLKPQNILVRMATLQIVVCDFGTGRAEANLGMTRLKDVTTFNYRSPEAMLLKNIYNCYDSSVDLWSLGCILCELLLNCKQPFFPGETQMTLMRNIITVLGSPDDSLMAYYKGQEETNVSATLLNLLTTSSKTQSTLNQKLSSLYQGGQKAAQAYSLVSDLLQFDPKARKSAALALGHPFLSDYYDEDEDKLLDVCDREFVQPFGPSCLEQELRAQLWDTVHTYNSADSAESSDGKQNLLFST